MSVAPHAGIVDFGTFTPPTSTKDGIQGEVPQPLQGEQDYVLTASGWVALSSLGTLIYQGTWDASTNTPTLVSSVGTQGYYYVVSVAGNTDLDGITTWTVGDWALFNGSVWQKIEGGSTVDITGGQINNTVIGNNTPAAATFTTLTATGAASLGGVVDAESLKVDATSGSAGSNNYISISGSTGSGTPIIGAWGTGTNVGMTFRTRGASNYNFATASTASNVQFRIANTTSAVNYIQVTGSATSPGGSALSNILFTGSDASVNGAIVTKGTGYIAFAGGANTGSQALRIVTTNAVNTGNLIQIQGAAAGSAPTISAISGTSGTDANIDLTLTAKGTGSVNLQSASVNVAKFLYETSTDTSFWKFRSRAGDGLNVGVVADGTASNIGFNISTKGNASSRFFTGDSGSFSGGVEQARVAHTASAVNYVQVTGAATTAFPVISSQGSDSAVSLGLTAKGGNAIIFFTNSGSNRGLRVSHAASSVNYVDVSGSATGSVPVIGNAGSDSNIGLAIKTTGTGAIDLAAGSSGVNISNGGTVTAITRTSNGSGYTSVPTITVSAPTTAGGVQATATANMFLNTVVVAGGGTGYTVNDVLTLSGGTSTQAAQVTVTSVSAGVITAVSIGPNYGYYSVVPTSPVSVTGGTGSGATFTVTWGYSGATITNAGSGYVEQPTVSFSGGGGSGAAAYATVGSYATIKAIGSGTNKVTNQAITFETPNSITSGNPAFLIRDAASFDSWYQMGPSSSQAFLVAKGNANASAYLGASGSGSVRFTTNGDSITEQMRVAHTASAVNYVQVTGAATTGTPVISAQGSDTNISLQLNAKGSGGVRTQFFHQIGTGYANYISISGNATTAAPTITAAGTDTNIDLTLTPKGTGNVRFGTYTGTALSIAGYIEIKDAGGTVRKLAVVA